jgi:pseudouridine kinase
MLCPVCAAGPARAIETKRSRFFRCSACSLVFRDPADSPDDAEARARYGLHRNNSDNGGYVAFLNRIIDRALAAAGPGVRRIVDWGSGPAAVCSDLLRSRGYFVDSWDPFFAADKLPRAESCDLALCIEVAEHFRDPLPDFLELASRVRPGGLLALHTHLVPDGDEAFRAWWYKEDRTHVAFYAEGTLSRLARIAGLTLVGIEEGRLALFRRPLPVLVAGGANFDIEGRPFAPLVSGDSNPGRVRFFSGGTGRNVAEDLRRLGIAVEFLGAVGDDGPGKELLSGCLRAGLGTAGISILSGETTSSYLSILDEGGEVSVALAGMDIYERFGPDLALEAAGRAAAAAAERSFLPTDSAGSAPFSAIAVDANLRPEAAEALLDRFPDVPAWLDPVSAAKARRFAAYRGGALIPRFRGLKPNVAEAESLTGLIIPVGGAEERGVLAAKALRARGAVGILYVSLGSEGAYWQEDNDEFFFVPPPAEIVSTTGAGDAFFASAVRSFVLGARGREEVVRAAFCAAAALGAPEASPPGLSAAALESAIDFWRKGETERE